MKQTKGKKLLSMLMVGMLTVGLLAGCGSGGDWQNMAAPADVPEETPAEAPVNTSDDAPTAAPVETSSLELGIEYATNFHIEYLENNVKLLTDADGIEHLLVPHDAEIPEGYDGVSVIRTPVDRVMYCSTTDVGLLAKLGKDPLYDTIAAVTTDVTQWTIPQVVERMESGEIAYIAQPWDQPTPNIEEVVELKPGLVVLYSGELSIQFGPQLDDLGIPYVVEDLTVEDTDEGLLEWMKFFAALYNEDETADRVFEAEVTRMNELRTMAADIPENDRPVVAFGLLSNGVVYTNAGDSRIAQTIREMGGIYALDGLEGSGSVQISLEEFMEKARDADIYICSSMINYLPDKAALLEDATYGDPLFAEFTAYQNDTIYVYAQDYYMAASEVSEKYEDWMAMIHPELMENYQLQHFVKLPDTAE